MVIRPYNDSIIVNVELRQALFAGEQFLHGALFEVAFFDDELLQGIDEPIFLQTLPLPATPSESSLTSDSDCLPPGRGDASVPQAGLARHAGQTKKPAILEELQAVALSATLLNEKMVACREMNPTPSCAIRGSEGFRKTGGIPATAINEWRKPLCSLL